MLSLCLAVVVAQVDTSVVNLATQAIGQDLKAGVTSLQWVVDGYNVAYATVLLTGGLIADLYGRRRAFVLGATILTVASVVCAFAPEIRTLIVARAVAGVGAACLIPASLALIRVTWTDPRARGRALGIWAGCNGVALAIGPTIGGLLIGRFGWRSVFGVVVPIAAVSVVGALASLVESAHPEGRRFDLAGQVTGAAALAGLVIAGIEAADSPIVAALIGAGALLAATLFLAIERRLRDAALVPLHIFRNRAFAGATGAAFGMTFGMYGLLFLLPLHWQQAGLLTPFGAGLALIPMALVFVAMSSASGRLQEQLGTRLMTALGMVTISAGLLVIAWGVRADAWWPVELGLAGTGLGMGLATGPLTAAAVGSVEARWAGTAAALVNVARMAGASIGVAVLGAVYQLASGGRGGLVAALATGATAQALGGLGAWRTIRTAAEAPA
jgi:EmrB/QacA subfamily drug resistance transporter